VKISPVTYKAEDGAFETKLERVIFEVDRVWKGVEETNFSLLRYADKEVSCSFDFKEDERYLVFADATSTEALRRIYLPPGVNTLDASRCLRTAPIDSAREDLQKLGSGRIPQ